MSPRDVEVSRKQRAACFSSPFRTITEVVIASLFLSGCQRATQATTTARSFNWGGARRCVGSAPHVRCTSRMCERFALRHACHVSGYTSSRPSKKNNTSETCDVATSIRQPKKTSVACCVTHQVADLSALCGDPYGGYSHTRSAEVSIEP